MRAHPLILVLWGVVLFANSCTSSRTRSRVDRLSSSLISSSSEEPSSERYSKMMARFGAASYEESSQDDLSPEDSQPPEPRQHVKRLVAPQDGVEYEVYQGVMGRPGVDFPVLPRIPKTSFSCRSVKSSGYYADLDTDCQVFHICDEGRKISFLCPNGTIFRQSHLICDWWWTVDCASSVEQYEQSAEQLAYDQRRYRSRVNSASPSPFSAEREGMIPAEQRQQNSFQTPVSRPRGRQPQQQEQQQQFQQQTNSYSNVRYNNNNNIDTERQLPAETGSFVNSRANNHFNTQQFASSTAAPVYTTSKYTEKNNYYNNNNNKPSGDPNYYNNDNNNNYNNYQDYTQTTPQYVEPLTTASAPPARYQQPVGRSYVQLERSRVQSTTTQRQNVAASSTTTTAAPTSSASSRRLKPVAVEVVNRGSSRYFSTTTPSPRVVVNSNQFNKFSGDFNDRVTPDPTFNAISTTDGRVPDVYRSTSKPEVYKSTSKPSSSTDAVRSTSQKSTSARGRKLRPVYVQVINRGTPKPVTTTPEITPATDTEIPTTVGSFTSTPKTPLVITQSSGIPSTSSQTTQTEFRLRVNDAVSTQQTYTPTESSNILSEATTVSPILTTTDAVPSTDGGDKKQASLDTKVNTQDLISSDEYTDVSANIEIFPPSGMPFTDEDVLPTKQTSTTITTTPAEQSTKNGRGLSRGSSKFTTQRVVQPTAKSKSPVTSNIQRNQNLKPIIVHSVNREDSKPTAISYSDFTLNPPRSSKGQNEFEILSPAVPQGFQTPTSYYSETAATETTILPTTVIPEVTTSLSQTQSERRGNVHSSSSRTEQDLFSSHGSVESRSFSSSQHNQLFNSKPKGSKTLQGVEIIEKGSRIPTEYPPTTESPTTAARDSPTTTESTTDASASTGVKFESKEREVQDIQITHRGDSNIRPDQSYVTTDSPSGSTDVYNTDDLLAYSTISENDLPSSTGFPIYGRKFSASDESLNNVVSSKSPDEVSPTTQRSSNGRSRKTFPFADSPRRRLISTTTTTPSIIQRALSKRLKTTPLPIPIRTATASRATTTTPTSPSYIKPTTIRSISKMLLPPSPANDLDDSKPLNDGKKSRDPKTLIPATTARAETHITGDRTGLEIPPSSGPGTLHSLATYFSTQGSGDISGKEVSESTTVPNETTERNIPTSTIDIDGITTLPPSDRGDKDVSPPSILTKLTIDSYSSLFSNKTPNSLTIESSKNKSPERLSVPFLISPESSVPPREGRKFALGNEPNVLATQSSKSATSKDDPADLLLKEDAPGLRELAQVFSRALSAYLDDPEEFRKVLSEVRPTAPPATTETETEFAPTTMQALITTTIKPRSPSNQEEEDEVLDYSDVSNSKSSRRQHSGRKYNFRSSTSSPNLINDDKLSVGSTLSPEYASDVPKELLESLDKSQSQHYTPQPPASVQTSQYSSTNFIAEAVNNLFDAPSSTDEPVPTDYTISPDTKQYTGSEYVTDGFPLTAGGVNDRSRPRYGGFQNNSKSIKRIHSAFISQTTYAIPTTTEPVETTTFIPVQKVKIVKPSRNLVPPIFDSPAEASANSSSERLEDIFEAFVPEELNNLAVIKDNVPKVLSAAGLNPSSPGVTGRQFAAPSSAAPFDSQPFVTASTGQQNEFSTSFDTFEPTASSLDGFTTVEASNPTLTRRVSESQESLVAANSARFNSQRIQEVFNNLAASRKWDTVPGDETQTGANETPESIISELNSLLADGVSTLRPEPTNFPTFAPSELFSTNPSVQNEFVSATSQPSGSPDVAGEQSTEIPTVAPTEDSATPGATAFPENIRTKRPPTHSAGRQPTHTSVSLQKFKSRTGVFSEEPKRLVQIDGFSRMAVSSKQFAQNRNGAKFTKPESDSVTTLQPGTTNYPYTVTPESRRSVVNDDAQKDEEFTTELPVTTEKEVFQSEVLIRLGGNLQTDEPNKQETYWTEGDSTTLKPTTVKIVLPASTKSSPSEDMVTVTPSNMNPATDLPGTEKETLINSPSNYYKDPIDLASPLESGTSDLTPEQLQSLGDLQKMLSLNNETSAFAEKMFMTLNETGKTAFVDMMRHVNNNSTVKRLVLLFVNRTEEESYSPNEVRSQLIEALLKHPEDEIELASQELSSESKSAKNRGGRKLSDRANINSLGENAEVTTTSPPVTTYRNKMKHADTTTTTSDILEMITSRSKTSLDEIPSPTSRSSSSGSVTDASLSQESDKRAIELLRSLYTLAARWG